MNRLGIRTAAATSQAPGESPSEQRKSIWNRLFGFGSLTKNGTERKKSTTGFPWLRRAFTRRKKHQEPSASPSPPNPIVTNTPSQPSHSALLQDFCPNSSETLRNSITDRRLSVTFKKEESPEDGLISLVRSTYEKFIYFDDDASSSDGTESRLRYIIRTASVPTFEPTDAAVAIAYIKDIIGDMERLAIVRFDVDIFLGGPLPQANKRVLFLKATAVHTLITEMDLMPVELASCIVLAYKGWVSDNVLPTGIRDREFYLKAIMRHSQSRLSVFQWISRALILQQSRNLPVKYRQCCAVLWTALEHIAETKLAPVVRQVIAGTREKPWDLIVAKCFHVVKDIVSGAGLSRSDSL
ncbi:hypothetical protein HDU97_006530 [Phlyctochytrium planicorne]|nr:hypothetical protein HDU97_006530 [Phlyctochytrium planicorne]